MNPRPTVILQALVATGALVASAVFGWRLPTIGVAATIVAVGLTTLAVRALRQAAQGAD